MNKSVFWSNHPQDADHGGEFEVSIGDVKTHAQYTIKTYALCQNGTFSSSSNRPALLRGVRWPRGRTFRSKWVTILLAYVK